MAWLWVDRRAFILVIWEGFMLERISIKLNNTWGYVGSFG